MTRLEIILKETEELSAYEKAELCAFLFQQLAGDSERDQSTVGKRGLWAWTESTRDEVGWSEFYPEQLRHNWS